jgi:uncharacterized membrane protein
LIAVLCVGLGFGMVNAANAHALFPHWAQDLAFFHQLVHSAATGGPWSSPLLFEPEGFFTMVHTHLVLPLVILAYRVAPHQETLLLAQGLFAGLAIWPAFRLGESVGGRAHGIAAVLALLVFGPFQALATADFRPAALFLPGLLGIFAAARSRDTRAVILWACLANLGRQEGAFLGLAAGAALLVVPWGRGTSRWAWRPALAAIATSLLWLGFWALNKPTLFFHVSPSGGAGALAADVAANRWTFLGDLSRSGALLGLLSPAGLIGALPIGLQMAINPREWGPMTGPAAHYHVFWLPFVMASAIAGSARLGRVGRVLLVVLCATAFPWFQLRAGPVDARALEAQIGPEERVAADDFVIHRYAGRAVLWNTRQVSQPRDEKPRLWSNDDWPIPLTGFDAVVAREQDALVQVALAAGWTPAARAGAHVLLRPPVEPAPR